MQDHAGDMSCDRYRYILVTCRFEGLQFDLGITEYVRYRCKVYIILCDYVSSQITWHGDQSINLQDPEVRAHSRMANGGRKL